MIVVTTMTTRRNDFDCFCFLLGVGPKFLMDSSGMFRGGPEGLTVSDPESGVFSTHELENMGCDDEDDEYSSKNPCFHAVIDYHNVKLMILF